MFRSTTTENAKSSSTDSIRDTSSRLLMKILTLLILGICDNEVRTQENSRNFRRPTYAIESLAKTKPPKNGFLVLFVAPLLAGNQPQTEVAFFAWLFTKLSPVRPLLFRAVIEIDMARLSSPGPNLWTRRCTSHSHRATAGKKLACHVCKSMSFRDKGIVLFSTGPTGDCFFSRHWARLDGRVDLRPHRA